MARPSFTVDAARELLNTTLNLNARRISVLHPGAWSTAFAFRTDDGAFVLRVANQADDFARDAYAARFAGPSLPIPKVTRRGAIEDDFYAISERVHGGFLDALDGSGLRRTLQSLLRMLNAMRTADVTASTGFGTWDETGNGTYKSWPDFLIATLMDSRTIGAVLGVRN